MRVFAIGDLHLSGSVDKPMDIFGAAWDNHAARIKENWFDTVGEDDVVLLPGDLSWAMTLEEAKIDLDYLSDLPGTKILLRGNHDYWWNSLSKVRKSLPRNIFAMQNDAMNIGDVSFVGTRGWTCPGSVSYSKTEDEKIFKREVGRLSLSVNAAKEGIVRIALMHYPPFNEQQKTSEFTEILEQAGVNIAVYGHLHGWSCKSAFEGVRNGIQYYLVSADHLSFKPKLIYEA